MWGTIPNGTKRLRPPDRNRDATRRVLFNMGLEHCRADDIGRYTAPMSSALRSATTT
jgi:hypothetical protein